MAMKLRYTSNPEPKRMAMKSRYASNPEVKKLMVQCKSFWCFTEATKSVLCI